MDLHKIVKKLVGKIDPQGESSGDKEKLENLKTMTHLIENLSNDVRYVARSKNSYESSVQVAGKYADNFLKNIEAEVINQLKEEIKELKEWKRCQSLKTKDRAGEWNALVNKDALNETTNKDNIEKFVEFLKAEGIVIEEENKPQNFEFLYDVWSGKNPNGLL